MCESEYLATLKDSSIFFAHFEHHPRAAPFSFVERNVLQMYQLRQQLPFAALAPVRSLAASFQRHRRTVTRTEAATDPRDGANERTGRNCQDVSRRDFDKAHFSLLGGQDGRRVTTAGPGLGGEWDPAWDQQMNSH